MIKKIIINVSGKTVEMTLEEAKELHAQLDEMFGSKINYIPHVSPCKHEPYEHEPYKVTFGPTTTNSGTSASVGSVPATT